MTRKKRHPHLSPLPSREREKEIATGDEQATLVMTGEERTL